jgi:NADH dehydrogenase/NADH:ubiquinone oxidoreductase subunit G
LEALIIEEDGKTENLEKEYLVKKKTYDLLPDAENNIKKLQNLSEQTSARLVELAKEW